MHYHAGTITITVLLTTTTIINITMHQPAYNT